ncbi:MAG TPA: proline dehydrogenase family protein [Bryobacteraceae bacterium]|nr:proline dehydrogenase family protein [Bryobacteraceae bacterium]
MLLRSTLLYLSSQPSLRRWMETSRSTAKLTARFVAGLRLEDAMEVAQRLARERILTSLDHLGESVTSLEEAERSRDSYLEALKQISAAGLDASVSIKLTQFGLDLSENACTANVERLVSEAARLGKMVEIDMESSEYVDRTLDIALAMHQAHHNVRAVIQAYLHRSEKDIERLSELRLPVRLCKGAYKEPASAALQRKSDVDANYVRLMKALLDHGAYPGLATHDEKIIAEAHRFTRERNIPADRYEFQMLYGIRRDLARNFARDGYRVRLYVPYGEAWYPYFMRRLAERPANLVFLARNLFRD